MHVTRHFRFAYLLILLAVPAAGADVPLRMADIVEQREPSSPRISPDGTTLAFLVRQSSIAANSYSTSLYVVTPGRTPRKILEESSITQVEWIPDSKGLTAALPRGGKTVLWRISPDAGKPVPLFEHSTRIQQYRWAPDGSRLVLVTSEEATPEERAAIENQGIVYDDAVFGIRNFTNRSWSLPKPQQIWLWDARTGRAQRPALDLSRVAGIRHLSWSPDGHRLAVEYVPRGGLEQGINTSHIGIIDLDRALFRPVVTWSGANRAPDWSPDGQAITFASMGPTHRTARFYENRMLPYIVGLGGGTARPVEVTQLLRFLSISWWDGAGKTLLFEYENRSRSTLYRMPLEGGNPGPILGGTDHFSGFHFDKSRKRAACVRQAFTLPPEIALVDVDTGEHQVLTDLNPKLREMHFIEGKELQ